MVKIDVTVIKTKIQKFDNILMLVFSEF